MSPVKIRCRSCGTRYNRPAGTLEQIDAAFHCDRCGASSFAAGAVEPGGGSAAGAALGALLGAAAGGVPAAVFGAVLGFLLGSCYDDP